MGVFWYPLEVAAGRDGSFRTVRALVDTGSLYTWIPRRILEELGLSPQGTQPFQMANGAVIERDTTEALVRIEGRTRHTVIVFGDPGDQTLLGAYTLEGFGLGADSVNKRLIPMPAIPAVSANPL